MKERFKETKTKRKEKKGEIVADTALSLRREAPKFRGTA